IRLYHAGPPRRRQAHSYNGRVALAFALDPAPFTPVARMCLLAIFFRAVPDAALVVGANREEFYNRPGEPPQIFDGPVRAVAGRDPRAGGTWFGVNAAGVVAAVTNRPLPAPTKKSRSRGLLVRDLLGCPSAKEAVALATRELDSGRYAGCNVF